MKIITKKFNSQSIELASTLKMLGYKQGHAINFFSFVSKINYNVVAIHKYKANAFYNGKGHIINKDSLKEAIKHLNKKNRGLKMGCDIHLYVEAYDTDSKTWFLTNDYLSGDNRDYNLFANLAGVRGPGPKPKGLPNDISLGAQYHVDKMGVDGHSHSYVPLGEFMQIQFDMKYDSVYIATLKMRKGWLTPDEETELSKWEYGPLGPVDWVDYSSIPIELYRVVFFFDN